MCFVNIHACLALAHALAAFPHIFSNEALWVLNNPDLLEFVLVSSSATHYSSWPRVALNKAYNVLGFVMKWVDDKDFKSERSSLYGTDIDFTARAVRADFRRYADLCLLMRSTLVVARAALDAFLNEGSDQTLSNPEAFFEAFPESLFEDPSFAIWCVSVLKLIKPSLVLVKAILRSHPTCDMYFMLVDLVNSWPSAFFEDKTLLAVVAHTSPHKVKLFSQAVRNDQLTMITALKSASEYQMYVVAAVWQSLGDRLRGNKEFVLEAIQHSKFSNNSTGVFSVLDCLSPGLQRDLGVVVELLRLLPSNIAFVLPQLQTKELVMDCLKRAKSGRMLSTVNKAWRKDRDVVKICLSNQPLDYEFVHGDLRYDVELATIALQAVSRCEVQSLRRFIPKSLQHKLWHLLRAKLQ
jgi:hypothetical protein